MHTNKKRGAVSIAPSPWVLAMAIAGNVFAELNVTLAEKIAGLRERQGDLVVESEELQAAADAAGRDLTEEEDKKIKANLREFDRLESEIKRRTEIEARGSALLEPNPRKTKPGGAGDEEDEPRAYGSGARDRGTLAERSKTFGFGSMGEFCRSIQQAAASKLMQVDDRLKAASASTISTEGVGADGGFAVPPEYRNAILTRVFDQESLLGLSDPIPLEGNAITMPSDMTTPWDSSGGIQAYWEGEANPYTQSKIKLEEINLKLAKLTALVPVTEELLEDNTALGGYINRKAPEKIDFKVSWALTWGNGAGMPLGFMNSPCLVTQAAESAQTTDTINATNIAKMWSRMPAGLRRTARWLIHSDAEPQLDLMTVGQVPVYLPPGGLADAPLGRLRGRPVTPHEVCETVGDLGDIMLIDMSSYLSAKKSSGLKAQTSIHLWFDQDLVAFKFTLRIGGQPWWSAPITPRDGSNTRSPFVTLASR